MTLYRTIIKKSWKLTLRSKYLWFFGLFAVLLGNGGEYELLFKSIGDSQKTESIWTSFTSQLALGADGFLNIGKRFWENPALTFAIIATYLFILAIFLFIFWMMSVSQIAIVNATALEIREKKHDIKIGLQKGIKHFWPVFSLNLIVKILITTSLALLLMARNTGFYLVVFIIIIPLVISVLFIIKYSIAYIVIRKERLLNAFVLAWALFRKNWIISLELAMLLYLFTFIAGLLFMFITFNVSTLFELLANSSLDKSSDLSFSILFTYQPAVLFAILAFIGSLLAIFQTATWTRLFLELDSKGAISKIERVFSK